MGLTLPKLLPLAQQIGNYLKIGADHYATLKSAGEPVDPEVVAFFLSAKMQDWNPEISGRSLLDDETRTAGARFLAGVAVNFSKERD